MRSQLRQKAQTAPVVQVLSCGKKNCQRRSFSRRLLCRVAWGGLFSAEIGRTNAGKCLSDVEDNELTYSYYTLGGSSRPKWRLKIVRAESFGNAFFVIGNGQVFGFFRSVRVLLLVLGFALQLALGFFSLLFLALPLFLSFCEGGTRASSHEHS